MIVPTPKNRDTKLDWYFEGFTDERSVLRRILIRPLPFKIGRNPSVDFVLPHSNVSKYHAEVYLDGTGLLIKDLGSTNGTFVNNVCIAAPTPLEPGDIVSFANFEFRILRDPLPEPDILTSTIRYGGQTPGGMLARIAEFQTMLKTGAVVPVFQPVIRLKDGERIGYELLGRGARDGFARLPRDLFEIAAGLQCEAELSRLFREKGSSACGELPSHQEVFLNVHPSEMNDPERLLDSLAEVCEQNPRRRINVEICEVAVTNIEEMRKLRTSLRSMNIGVAYDDFGSGQARLLELVEVPPDYLKFDMSLVHGLHMAPDNKQHMVEMLVHFAEKQEIHTIAEGVESPDEAEICRLLGFHAAQGFYFGRPSEAGSAPDVQSTALD